MFGKPPELTKITAPTADICARSKPSPEGKALIVPGMTPTDYHQALQKNKLSVDSVHFLAHGLPPMDAICWACQGCKLVMPKLSLPELEAFKLTEAWLKFPTPDLALKLSLQLGKIDFTGPASWLAQAVLWIAMPALLAAAVIGAILLAAGLKISVAMPAIPKPKLELPMLPLPPELLLKLQLPPLVIPIPVLDQPKLMKLLLPFIDLGVLIALGKVTCR